jgi:threonylcarbamoyladenosine tRNA methylthiotransferase CDKAL1
LYSYIESYILKNLLGCHSLLYRFYANKKEYFYVRISRGCIGNCSYCGIRKAIGNLKSKKISDIVNEFKQGLAKGYKIFIISSDDAGSYGLDINSNFAELLDEITKIPDDFKIIIHSFSPVWMVRYIDELEKIVKRNKIKIIDIPIQSASERILKLMHRYSDVEKMRDTFLRLKKADPTLGIDTDIIVGFPTETDKDFKESLCFFQEIDFNSGSCIGFSCKSGTDAEKIEPKVSNDEIVNRMKYVKKYLRKSGYKVKLLSNIYFMFSKK